LARDWLRKEIAPGIEVPVAVLRGVPLLVTDDAFGVVPKISIIATAVVENFGVLSYEHT